MRKILLVLVVFCTTLKSSAQEYKDLFSDLDSIAKTNVGSNFYRIIRMMNYEYNQKNDSLTLSERVVYSMLKINDNKKFQIFAINDQNKDVEDLLNNFLLKSPPFPIENFKKGNEIEFITVKFDLKKYNYDGLKFEEVLIKQKEEIKTNRLDELDFYPSYGGNPEKFTDKEKALRNMNNTLSKFIKQNFKYPEYALEKNIQGKTISNFIINKEGDVRTIISYFSHPVLQNQALTIIENFPKFTPGIKDGKPVSTNYQVPISFKLR
mgnify:CR=1 FL=1